MTEFKRILVPLDGSPLSQRALPVATTMAQKFGSEIVLLRVLDIPMPAPPTSYPEVSIGWERQARACAHRKAQSCLDALQQEVYEQGIEVRARMCDQSPAEDILQVTGSEKVDLIVMSAHGQGGLASWAVGDVADKVARHSPCPVLLVRYAGPAGTAGGA